MSLTVESLPKYARLEIERRWLVRPDLSLTSHKASQRQIEDVYLAGTRLRLRKVTNAGQVSFKLGKKHPHPSGFEAVVSVWLSAEEHAVLAALPGRSVRKIRHAIRGGSLDLYQYPNAGLMVFEVEFPSINAARNYQAPDFVDREITRDPSWSGFALSQEPD